MAEVLSDTEIASGLEGSLWRHRDGVICRDLSFGDFKEAIAYVNRVAEIAEAAGHHPDVLVHDWNKVQLRLVTHSAGGVTRSDLDMARRLDEDIA